MTNLLSALVKAASRLPGPDQCSAAFSFLRCSKDLSSVPSKWALLRIPLIFRFLNVLILFQNESSGQLAPLAAFISVGGRILDTIFLMCVYVEPNYSPLGLNQSSCVCLDPAYILK